MSLYDRLVAAEALRFDRIHPMTAGAYFTDPALFLRAMSCRPDRRCHVCQENRR